MRWISTQLDCARKLQSYWFSHSPCLLLTQNEWEKMAYVISLFKTFILSLGYLNFSIERENPSTSLFRNQIIFSLKIVRCGHLCLNIPLELYLGTEGKRGVENRLISKGWCNFVSLTSWGERNNNDLNAVSSYCRIHVHHTKGSFSISFSHSNLYLTIVF